MGSRRVLRLDDLISMFAAWLTVGSLMHVWRATGGPRCKESVEVAEGPDF